MKQRVNRQILTQRIFDSGSLGALASVVHQFERPGQYRALVRRNGDAIGSFSLVVADVVAEQQLNIDLSAIASPAGNTHQIQHPHAVQTKGYVVFYASVGSGYSVVVGDPDAGDRVEFDSEQLTRGDLFALSLFEPTAYSVTDKVGDARGEIAVIFNREVAPKLRSLDTVYVEAQGGAFEPARVEIVATQGLVFRVNNNSRIVIEKLGRADDEERPPPVRWQKQGRPR